MDMQEYYKLTCFKICTQIILGCLPIVSEAAFLGLEMS